MMIKNLKSRWPEARLREAFEALSLSPKIRAEELAREQFIELTRRLATA
jgi:16S rRNA A1518/A1519 N6-dimethyltransferase RsmA/KsgA/DIM1 with predicted DNA glycosylase/AP lyase activity